MCFFRPSSVRNLCLEMHPRMRLKLWELTRSESGQSQLLEMFKRHGGQPAERTQFSDMILWIMGKESPPDGRSPEIQRETDEVHR